MDKFTTDIVSCLCCFLKVHIVKKGRPVNRNCPLGAMVGGGRRAGDWAGGWPFNKVGGCYEGGCVNNVKRPSRVYSENHYNKIITATTSQDSERREKSQMVSPQSHLIVRYNGNSPWAPQHPLGPVCMVVSTHIWCLHGCVYPYLNSSLRTENAQVQRDLLILISFED